jgi:hypothetical protein
MGDDDNIKSSSEEKTPYLGIPIQLVPGHIKKYWQMWKNDEIPEQRKSYYKHMFKKYPLRRKKKKRIIKKKSKRKLTQDGKRINMQFYKNMRHRVRTLNVNKNCKTQLSIKSCKIKNGQKK